MRNLPRLFELSPLFTDHMVLQREAAIPIWGTAENGRKIQVELCGQKKAAVCANGQWRVILTPLPAGGPREHWMRAALSTDPDGRTVVTPFPDQDSSLVGVFARADALLRRRAGTPAAAKGDIVDVLPLRRG